MWNMTPAQELLEFNAKIDKSKPIIGFCPDWRMKVEDGKPRYFYMKELFLSMQ